MFRARDENGIERWATQFHDEFVRNGTRPHFFCGGCGIPLVGKAIFREPKGVCPHFATHPDYRHANDCQAWAAYQAGVRKRAEIQKVKIGDDVLEIPEALVGKRSQSSGLSDNASSIPPTPGNSQLGGKGHDPGWLAQYSSSLVSTFALAHILVVDRCCDVQREKKLTLQERNRLIKEKLSACRLSLFGFRTNYDDGFRSTKILPHSYERIYRGYGTVTATARGMEILSRDQMKDRDGSTFAAIVAVPAPPDIGATRWHKTLYAKLSDAAETGKKIRWFAYGKFDLRDDSYELQIDDADLIYCE